MSLSLTLTLGREGDVDLFTFAKSVDLLHKHCALELSNAAPLSSETSSLQRTNAPQSLRSISPTPEMLEP